jgi:tagatose-6-phosphate ketose/aldose isomerase
VNPNLNVRELLAHAEAEQISRGYGHTFREILQQPDTWRDTCGRVLEASPAIGRMADGIASVVLTGSGSSLFAGECVRLALQRDLGITTAAIGAGDLLTQGTAALPSGRPGLLISIARSGDSPESAAAISLLLDAEPQMRHLAITCNPAGRLATEYGGDPRVEVIMLDDRTNDRSLAMTSSVTNMALAARFVGMGHAMRHAPNRYRLLCERLSRACEELLRSALDPLARVAALGFRRAVFLGNGSRFGAAREAALKMLEMTDGRVATLAETYLGVRHGPLSFIHKDTLVVCFLSSDALVRAYESDLIRGLDRKQLGAAKVIVGENIPPALLRDGDTALECPGLAEIGDDNAPVLDAVVGQLLAFFRCLAEGLHPDSPCVSGAIHRVVESFPLYESAGNRQA